jgi:osmotically-inducible protein OsmY
MKTDAQLKDDVTEEVRWDPRISDAEVIGVGVKDGAVILSGQAPSYAEKMAAAQAAAASGPGVASVESHLVIAP